MASQKDPLGRASDIVADLADLPPLTQDDRDARLDNLPHPNYEPHPWCPCTRCMRHYWPARG
jgi:hypothetical protein